MTTTTLPAFKIGELHFDTRFLFGDHRETTVTFSFIKPTALKQGDLPPGPDDYIPGHTFDWDEIQAANGLFKRTIYWEPYSFFEKTGENFTVTVTVNNQQLHPQFIHLGRRVTVTRDDRDIKRFLFVATEDEHPLPNNRRTVVLTLMATPAGPAIASTADET